MSDVVVVRDRRRGYSDGTLVRARVLAVPESDRFPDGIKYAFHYGHENEADPVIRFDNYHGDHELHIGAKTYEIEYLGLESLAKHFRAALPASKRGDW